MDEENLRPSPAYQRRLEEVAADSRALAELISKANILPPAFQRQSVLDSCNALIGLPGGTTEGSHAILETALERIGSWRFDYFGAEEDDAPEDGPDPDQPTFTRGDAIDRAMEHLASTITFALESQRARRTPPSTPPPAPVPLTPPDAQTGRPEAIDAVETMGAKAQDLRGQIEGSPIANTPEVEAPKRALTDAINLRFAALSELYQTRIRPWLLDRLASATPELVERLERSGNFLCKSGDAIGDLGRTLISDNLQRVGVLVRFTGKTLTQTASLIRKIQLERTQPLPPEPEPPPFDLAEAHAMILRGEAPPEAWVPLISMLDFEDSRKLSELTPVSSLSALKRLRLKGTAVTDLAPIASLSALEWLDLDGLAVTDLAPIASLSALNTLDLSRTAVADLTPIASLSALKRLRLQGTAVTDLTPVASLCNLASLNLSGTTLNDLAPIASLPALKWLSLRGTAVTDLAVAQTLADRGTRVVSPSGELLRPRTQRRRALE